MKKLIYKSILAGLLIAIAGSLFLQCENKIVGSILFSLGLISVILGEANLYTGKIGYINSKREIIALLIMLLINILTAFIVGLLYKACVGFTLAVDSRLVKEWYRILWDSTICGACVFLAVDLYKRTKNIFTIILPVMAFILTSGEHCIAYAFYLGTGTISLKAVGYLVLMIIGNSIGAIILKRLMYVINKGETRLNG